MGTKLNVLKSEMETRFVVLSLIIGRVSSEEIWPFQGFVTVSLLLVDLHPEKILFFLSVKIVRSVSIIWGQNDRK